GPEVVPRGRIGGVGGGAEKDALVDGDRTEAVLARVLEREPLDERRARRKLVPLDLWELEAPGERPGNLFGAREPEAHDGIREALARGAATVLGAGEIRLRKEARGRQPLAQGSVPIRFHVFRAIHTRRGSGPHRPRFLGPGFLASRPLIVSGLCKTGGTFLTTAAAVCKLVAAMMDRIRGRLGAAGHAWTRPRAAVLRALGSTSSPVTAEEIHARLRAVP